MVMARYDRNYIGERRTRSVGIKLTPTERQEFETAANALGVPLSAYMRDLCVKRSPTAAAPALRRSPQNKALLNELSAIGNNVNQLAKHANTVDELPALPVLLAAMEAVKKAMAHVLEL